MHTFKVKFYLRPEPNKDCKHTVQARIYLDHQREYLTCTKVAVLSKSWNARLEKIMSKTSEGRLLNRRLENLRKQITGIYLQHEHDEALSVEFIMETYLGQTGERSGREGVCSFFKKTNQGGSLKQKREK